MLKSLHRSSGTLKQYLEALLDENLQHSFSEHSLARMRREIDVLCR